MAFRETTETPKLSADTSQQIHYKSVSEEHRCQYKGQMVGCTSLVTGPWLAPQPSAFSPLALSPPPSSQQQSKQPWNKGTKAAHMLLHKRHMWCATHTQDHIHTLHVHVRAHTHRGHCVSILSHVSPGFNNI